MLKKICEIGGIADVGLLVTPARCATSGVVVTDQIGWPRRPRSRYGTGNGGDGPGDDTGKDPVIDVRIRTLNLLIPAQRQRGQVRHR